MKKVSTLIIAATCLVMNFGCTKKEKQPETQSQSQSAMPDLVRSPLGTTGELKIEDVKAGTGPEAVAGKTVVVHYTGRLTDGKEFDSSRNEGRTPFSFQLGAGNVIKGWDQGVAGMKVGGQRKLIIPPQLGYGSQGAGSVIPPNATLLFDVELLEVK